MSSSLAAKKPPSLVTPQPTLPPSAVKFDHDYCSPKRPKPVKEKVAVKRKAIEIPFDFPTTVRKRHKHSATNDFKSISDKKCDNYKIIDNGVNNNNNSKMSVNNVKIETVQTTANPVLVTAKPVNEPVQMTAKPVQVSLLKANQPPCAEIEIEIGNENDSVKVDVEPVEPVSAKTTLKKKINLSEYKTRREGCNYKFENDIDYVANKEVEDKIIAQIRSEAIGNNGESIAQLPKTLPPVMIKSVRREDPRSGAPPARVPKRINGLQPKDPILAATQKAMRRKEKEAAAKSYDKITSQKYPVSEILPMQQIAPISLDDQIGLKQ